MGEPAYDLIHNPDSILILSVIHTEGGMGDADLKNTHVRRWRWVRF